MEIIYSFIQENPKIVTWAFALFNVFLGMFYFFKKQSHDKAMENIKHSLIIKKEETLPLFKKLSELEELAGEAKEIVTSYKAIENKRKQFGTIYERLDQFAGKLSKYPKLMSLIRDLNQHCAIMVQDEEDPHKSCRDDVLKFYNNLINEINNVKEKLKG
jgi:hypothetical protein